VTCGENGDLAAIKDAYLYQLLEGVAPQRPLLPPQNPEIVLGMLIEILGLNRISS
jgi:hypothetical protein